jgi:hypothetical protein
MKAVGLYPAQLGGHPIGVPDFFSLARVLTPLFHLFQQIFVNAYKHSRVSPAMKSVLSSYCVDVQANLFPGSLVCWQSPQFRHSETPAAPSGYCNGAPI